MKISFMQLKYMKNQSVNKRTEYVQWKKEMKATLRNCNTPGPLDFSCFSTMNMQLQHQHRTWNQEISIPLGLVLAYSKNACKVPTLTAWFRLADDIRHHPRHQLPEVRHIFRGQSQHQLDFKFGIFWLVLVLPKHQHQDSTPILKSPEG